MDYVDWLIDWFAMQGWYGRNRPASWCLERRRSNWGKLLGDSSFRRTLNCFFAEIRDRQEGILPLRKKSGCCWFRYRPRFLFPRTCSESSIDWLIDWFVRPIDPLIDWLIGENENVDFGLLLRGSVIDSGIFLSIAGVGASRSAQKAFSSRFGEQ